MSDGTRLNKYIAQAGIASRRRADELIAYGKVRINGKVVRELGTIVAPGDKVDVSGTPIAPITNTAYLVVHKPAGMMTTMRDPQRRRTVAELIPKGMPRVVPVGRLDYDTAGVLLMTNDGDLANRLMHPRYGVEKTYRATIAGRLSPDDVKRLHDGVALDDGQAAAGAQVRVVAVRAGSSVVDVTVHEGRNRLVRRLFEALGHPVQVLVRLRFGPIALGDLPTGHSRSLTPKELSALIRVASQDGNTRPE
ncbi:MAG: pseudouridine synthase [Candidatus Aquilonibacter sp.]